MTEQEEETGATSTKGRPNAFWARLREEQIEEQEGDGYGGAFRGVKPRPHGGSMTVTAEHILGAEELCWCGQPVGHSWPGKTVGAKHPKVGHMSTTSSETIDRKDLRAFHRRLQDFVLHCVTDNGLRYRATKNGVILYPPDGSTPMTVHARNTDRQLRQLQKWYVEHVHQEPEAEPVTDEAIQRLIETKNDPAEHPVEPKVEAYEMPQAKEEPEVVSPNDEWVPVMREKDGPSPNIVTNGEKYRCIWCAGTEHEYIDGPRSQGGHFRMYHTDTTTLHGPEAKARAIATARVNRQTRDKVTSAIDTLIEAVGYRTVSESAEADWQHKVDEMERRAEKAEARAEELEAKLALIREATGL